MFQCVRCPSAYHLYGEGGAKSSSSECIPAGSVLIAGRNIICPAHFKVRNNDTRIRRRHRNILAA